MFVFSRAELKKKYFFKKNNTRTNRVSKAARKRGCNQDGKAEKYRHHIDYEL